MEILKHKIILPIYVKKVKEQKRYKKAAEKKDEALQYNLDYLYTE